MGKYLHPQDNLLGLQRTDPWTQLCMIQRGWTPWSVCEAGTQNCQHKPNTKLFEGHLMLIKSTHFVVEVGVMFNGIEGRTHKAQLHPHCWTHLRSGESWEFQLCYNQCNWVVIRKVSEASISCLVCPNAALSILIWIAMSISSLKEHAYDDSARHILGYSWASFLHYLGKRFCLLVYVKCRNRYLFT